MGFSSFPKRLNKDATEHESSGEFPLEGEGETATTGGRFTSFEGRLALKDDVLDLGCLPMVAARFGFSRFLEKIGVLGISSFPKRFNRDTTEDESSCSSLVDGEGENATMEGRSAAVLDSMGPCWDDGCLGRRFARSCKRKPDVSVSERLDPASEEQQP